MRCAGHSRAALRQRAALAAAPWRAPEGEALPDRVKRLVSTSGGWRNRWRELARIRAKEARQRREPRGRAFKPVRLAQSLLAQRDVELPWHEQQQEESGLPWRNVAAMVIMRDPQLLELPEDWEVDMQKLSFQLDRDYRMWRPPVDLLNVPLDVLDREKTMPFLFPFNLKPEQQRTDADERGDLKSLQRSLTEPLYLIFKGKGGSWQFPQASYQDGETMRATAARGLATVVGTSVQSHPGGNFPLAHWWYAYPEARRAKMKAYGAKVFFMRSTYIGGEVDIRIPERVLDYAWVTPEELAEYFEEDLYSFLKHVL